MKILVLGHTGMLGHMVCKYLSSVDGCELITTNDRWPDDVFKKTVRDFIGNFVINCVGAIPQRTDNFEINYILPMWLDKNIDCKIIHVDTDSISSDAYGISKKSVIGHEITSRNNLLEWFLYSTDKVYGWSEYYWNGITTLQWAKECWNLINNWNDYKLCTIISSECISKYRLLNIIKDVYNKKIDIIEDKNERINNCLDSIKELPSIREQLIDMKEFYARN